MGEGYGPDFSFSPPEALLPHTPLPISPQLRVKLGRSVVSTYSTSKTAGWYGIAPGYPFRLEGAS